MATISAPGLGSGLDVNSLVNQLVALERVPINLLDQDKAELNAELSAWGQMKSALSDFQSAMDNLGSLDKFKIFTATSSNEGAFTGSASSSAAGGSYNINVTSLAAVHKLSSAAYADSSTVVGEGTLDISVGADTFQVTIDSSNSTLAGIRDAINSASDNAGVTASIVNADGGSHLVLTSDESGTANALSVAATGTLTALDSASLSTVQAASDATLTIDGFAITSSTNDVSGAVDGLTLELKALGSGTLTLTRDDESITESVQEFVDAYNNIRNTIDDLRAGDLEAEGTLLTVESLIQGVFNTSAGLTGAYNYLSEVGITTGEDGDLVLDSTELNSALDNDFNDVAQLFGNDTGGFASRLEALAGNLLATDGVIDAREDGINTQLDRLDDRRDQLERRIELTEQRLLAQFTALDSLVSSLNSTSAFLTQQLANLSNLSPGNGN